MLATASEYRYMKEHIIDRVKLGEFPKIPDNWEINQVYALFRQILGEVQNNPSSLKAFVAWSCKSNTSAQDKVFTEMCVDSLSLETIKTASL